MIRKSTRRGGGRGVSAAALVLFIAIVAACGGDGETRLERGLDAAGQAEDQGRLIEENQKRLDDVAGSAP